MPNYKRIEHSFSDILAGEAPSEVPKDKPVRGARAAARAVQREAIDKRVVIGWIKETDDVGTLQEVLRAAAGEISRLTSRPSPSTKGRRG